jgi:uncharacterized protein (TIGR02391 family)
MAKGSGREEPAIQVKHFTPDEISEGMKRLQKRIEEVRSLNPDALRYDDQRISNVEFQIRETICDIFGPSSPEFQQYQHHEIWHGDYNMFDSDHDRQRKFAEGIPQTVHMLEGLIARLEEKRANLATDPVERSRVAFQGLSLHPRIAQVSTELYQDGHYSNAVFDASKALINFVKEKSGRHDDGAPLMRTVFSVKDPILAFNDLKDQSDRDEQEGMMHLFEGAVLGIRNPRGHSFLDDSPDRALEYIALLSMLANRLEEAKRLK